MTCPAMLCLRRLLSAPIPLLLAACASAPPSPPPRPQPAYDVVAQIRAAGHRDDSAVEVTPVRDPAVQDLVEGARADESARRYPQAAAKLDQALSHAPDAPDILQDRAEVAVRLHDYAQAEQLARRSYAHGPKLGALCARNWQTVLEMRKLAEDAAGTASARKALSGCHVDGVIRM